MGDECENELSARIWRVCVRVCVHNLQLTRKRKVENAHSAIDGSRQKMPVVRTPDGVVREGQLVTKRV